MFKIIRYKIAIYYAKKAQAEIGKGDFKSIRKGLNYFEKSVAIVPYSKGLDEIAIRIRDITKGQQH